MITTDNTGTGKEVIAGLIHRLSRRSDESYITLNAVLAYIDNSISRAGECTGIKKDRFYMNKEN